MSSIFYSESGKGLPVVFFHGFCETSQLWAEFESRLSRRYRIITLDLPGFGKSPLPAYSFSLMDVAVEIQKLLEEKKIGKYILIGHSLGGYVALALARQFSFTLRGLGLFHSSVFADTPDKKESRTKLIQFIKSNGVKPFIKTFIPSLFYEKNHQRLDEKIEEQTISASKTSPETVMEYARAMRDRQGSDRFIKGFKKPVMFIIGENDGKVPLRKSLAQATLPANSHILRLRNNGHMGMYEHPEESLEFVEKFIRFCK